MAANDVIELDSASSDEEFEKPPRKPIGWNYQLTTSNKEKEKTTGKANGAVIHKIDDTSDDLEILEVKSDSKTSKISRGSVISTFPPSSTRSEIRKQIRNTSQASISDFFGNGKLSNLNAASIKSNNAESRNSFKEEKAKSKEETDKSNSARESERKDQGDVEDNSETSIAALENFVSRWVEVKSSKDDNKILDKLWKYYYMAHSSYTHSRKFINMIEGATRKLSIDNVYVVIKDILDSLKRYKDLPYKEKEEENLEKHGASEDSMGEGGESSPLPEETEEDRKRNSRLRKVEKKMKEISQKIKELEVAEVDFDDDTNSAYLVEERLKKQFTKLHDYYCKVAECSAATGRPIERKFRYQGSRWPEVNKRISTWVNKNKEFPDYVDILNLLKKVTRQSSLPLRPETVRVQAQEIFRDVGKMLKERRESDDLYSIYSYAEDEIEDPATKDEELNQKLSENESIAKEKLDKVFQEFVDKDAEAREYADKNVEKTKKNSKVEKDREISNTDQRTSENKGDKEHNSEFNKRTEGVQGVEDDVEENAEDDIDDDVEDVVDEDNDDDEDGDEDDDIEEIEYIETTRHQLNEQSSVSFEDEEDVESTDDDLNDVLASACVEEAEFSEEDIPVIDSEEHGYHNTEADDDSEVVCMDDDDDGVEVTTLRTSSPLSTSSRLSPGYNALSKKRMCEEGLSSPKKKQCLEIPYP